MVLVKRCNCIYQENKITGQQIKIEYIDSDYKFVEEINLTFPLISDPDKKLIPLYSDGRIASLINKQGIVQMIVKGMPANNDILQKMKQLEKQIFPGICIVVK